MSEFNQLAAPGYPVFLGSEFSHPAPENAFFHILPVPLETSVTYGTGTYNGPKSILEASWQLETWDGKSYPGQKGIFTHPPVAISDNNDQTIDNIATAAKKIIQAEKKLKTQL